MLLTLKVLSFQGVPPTEEISASFNQSDGTIGRSDDNNLVLPDPDNFISRRHASIQYEGGRYIIADTSLSGTVIDQSETPLKKTSAEIRDGMRIDIGDYELIAHISEIADPAAPPTPASDGLLTDVFAHPGVPDPSPAPFNDVVPEQPVFDPPPPSQLEDPFADFGDPAPDSDPIAPLEKGDPVFDNIEPPNSHFEPSNFQDLPEDFDFEDLLDDASPKSPLDQPSPIEQDVVKSAAPDPEADQLNLDSFADLAADIPESVVEIPAEVPPEPAPPADQPEHPPQHVAPDPNPPSSPTPPPVSAPPMERGPANDQLFRILLEAIDMNETDLEGATTNEATVRLIGEMFREMVEGLMALLRSRTELKSQFRISVTVIQPVENNPLKFSVSVTDALNALLKPGHKAYLNPIDAIRTSFDDISNHQLAMMAGIQASLSEILQKFDPKHLENQVEAGVFSKKETKCWEAYSKSYQQLVDEAREDFFGDAFVKAYEDQMQGLESMNRGK